MLSEDLLFVFCIFRAELLFDESEDHTMYFNM